MKALVCLLCLFLLVMTHASGEQCPRVIEKVQGKRHCRKRCDKNSRCASSRKTCICDGYCGKSCINTNLSCTELSPRIEHGWVTISPFNKFGAIAKYYCDDGFEIQGVQARVCQGDETWSHSEPTCIVSVNPPSDEQHQGCGVPPKVHNAHHDGDALKMNFEVGVMLQYECDSGYTTSKASIVRAWCVGHWVGPNMTCSHAGCPINSTTLENGRVETPEQMTTGAQIRYFCNQGYHLAGSHIRICQSNGYWNGREPSCEKVTCDSPPHIRNADVVNFEEASSRFPSGQQVTYRCNSGYEMEGDPRIMCNSEGVWVGLNMQCRPINCGFPGDIANGWRVGYLFSYGNTVLYNCDEGYELIGQSQRRCNENGKWTGYLPRCDAVACPTLRAPLQGKMIGSGNAFGTVLRFECTDGFHLTGSIERRCQADKSWSGETVHCDLVKCPWPQNFWNGYIIGEKSEVKSKIFFSCNTYTNFNGEALDAVCLENGQWSQSPPKCLGQCRIPIIEDAEIRDHVEGDWLRHGTILEYYCTDGLVPDVSSRVTCHNGTWTSIPRCVPAPCESRPPHVNNGLRIFDGLKHNSRAKYICRSGFRLRGMTSDSSFLTCKYGAWVGGDPICKEFYCPNPGTIANGKIYKKGRRGTFDFEPYITTIRHGARLIYRCNEEFARRGPSGATCVNGQWRPRLGGTKCVPRRHAPFPKMWHPIEEANQN